MRRTARGIIVDFAELSDPGRDPSKRINEDACGFAETALGLLSVLCDGMGGHAEGSSASQTAVRVVLERGRNADPNEPAAGMLHAAVTEAGAAVYALGGDAPREGRPGSTCVAALLNDAGVVFGHVGDSRLMLARAGHLTRLTRDHTLVRQLVDAGLLTEAAAQNHPDANQITRALGMTPSVEVELRTNPLELFPQDVLLLTSDGITDLIPDPELLDLVQENIARGATAVCQKMVSLANLRGGHDNLTVQTIHVLEVSQQRSTPRQAPAGDGRTLLLDDAADTSPAATQRSPVAVDVDGHVAPPTLPERDAPAPTVLEERFANPPGRTVLDEPAAAEPSAGRTTQPDLAAVARAAGGPGLDPEQPSAGALLRRRRLLTRLGALTVLLLLGLLLAWWGRRTTSRSDDQEPPPPAPTPTSSAPAFERPFRPRHRRRPHTDLQADPDVPPRAPIATSAPVESPPPPAFP